MQLRKLPDDVIESFRKISEEVIQESIATDPVMKKVYDSYSKFKNNKFNFGSKLD